MTFDVILNILQKAWAWLKARPHIATWLLIGLLALFVWDRFRHPAVVTVTDKKETITEKKVTDTETQQKLVEAEKLAETLRLQLTETQKKVNELSKRTKTTTHTVKSPDGTVTTDTVTETLTDSKTTTDTDKTKTEDKTKTDDKTKTETDTSKTHTDDQTKTETETKTTVTPMADLRRWHMFMNIEAGPTLSLHPELTYTFAGGFTYRLFTVPLLKLDVNTGLIFTAPIKPKADPSLSAILGLSY